MSKLSIGNLTMPTIERSSARIAQHAISKATPTVESNLDVNAFNFRDLLTAANFTPESATKYAALLTAISQGETGSANLFNTVKREVQRGSSKVVSRWGSLQWSPTTWKHVVSKGALTFLSSSDPRLGKILTSVGWNPNSLLSQTSTFADARSINNLPAALVGSAQFIDEVIKKEFWWNGKQWLPRWDSIARSANWADFSSRNSHILKNKLLGFAALSSLIWVNGASWYKASKLRHTHRPEQDANNFKNNLDSIINLKVKGDVEPIKPDTSKVKITSDYGVIRHGHPHQGIDYAANPNTPMYAHRSGKITGWSTHKEGGDQLTFSFDDAPGWKFTAAHLAPNSRRAVGTFSAGDLLAKTGITGTPRGPHLHVSARLNGKRANPSQAPIDIKEILIPYEGGVS